MEKEHSDLFTNETERQLYYIEKLNAVLKEKEALLGRKVTCHVTTFGCQMNARDSEKLAGILQAAMQIKEFTDVLAP